MPLGQAVIMDTFYSFGTKNFIAVVVQINLIIRVFLSIDDRAF